ncbi:MAG: SpoIIE family protein phosphatase, partial [Planctomycetes bacterium]|nr:SpoIIE family protein phosphatase [Planctomycetota bacterium]
MCGARAAMDALRREVEALRRQDQALQERVSRLDAELRLAGAVQKGLLPSTLPAIEGLDVHTWFRPAGPVSGDMYDVTRLDDTHVAFSLIDATGHGAAAGLLSAYVKRSFSRRALSPGRGGPLEPDEVLRQLNRDLLAAQLQDCHFVAVLLAVFDEAKQVIRWARGGNPYPVLARPGERLRRFSSQGPLVGISPDAEFEVVELALEPGDTLVFHTDGLEPLLGTSGTPDQADAQWTAWFTELASRPIRESLRKADAQLKMSRSRGVEIDDATVLVLQAHNKPRQVNGTHADALAAEPCLAGV